MKQINLIFWALLLISPEVFGQYRNVENILTPDGKEIKRYQESYALIIGNGNYSLGWDPLPGALKDVDDVTIALKNNGFNVTTKKDVTRDGFDQAFGEFALINGKNKNNRLLFYFAGHGHTIEMANEEQLGYLVMIDAPDPDRDPVGFDRKSIDMEYLVTQAKKIKADHVLFMFDCCFSGTILNLRDRVAPEAISDVVKYPVRQFITAGRAHEPVPDHSYFKQAFLDILTGRDKELIQDGYLTGEELGLYLKNKVPTYNPTQHPQYGKIRDPILNKGDFVFVLSDHPSQTGVAELQKTEFIGASAQTPTADEKLGIWMARIEGDDQNKIQQGLLTLLRRYRKRNSLLVENLEIRDLEWVISSGADDPQNHDYARKIGRKLNAMLVGWGGLVEYPIGNASVTKFFPRITMVKGAIVKGEEMETDLSGIVYEPLSSCGLLLDSKELESGTSQNAEQFARFVMGWSYFILDSLQMAIKEFEDILEKANNQEPECRGFIVDVHLFCGILHWYLSEFKDTKMHLKESKKHYEKAIQYNVGLNDQLRLAHIENNLGLVYLYDGNQFKKAIDNFSKAENIYSQLSNKEFEQTATYNNLTMAHNHSKNYREAIKAGQKGLDFFKKNFIFTVSLSFEKDLESDTISDSLFKVFSQKQIHLSSKSYCYEYPDRHRWTLIDKYNSKNYFIKKAANGLEVYQYPEVYAQLQNNIGIAYYYLSKKENKEKNLEAAISAYEDALEIRQKKIFAIGYSKQNYNLGLAHEALFENGLKENLDKALTFYKEAFDVYEKLNLTEKTKKIKKAIDRVQKKIKKLKS